MAIGEDAKEKRSALNLPKITPGGGRSFHFNGGESNSGMGVPRSSDVWMQVVMVRDGTQIWLYLDGVLQRADPVHRGNPHVTNSQLYIGAMFGEKEFWKGAIDELKIFGEVLTAGDVLELYQSEICNSYQSLDEEFSLLLRRLDDFQGGTRQNESAASLEAKFTALVERLDHFLGGSRQNGSQEPEDESIEDRFTSFLNRLNVLENDSGTRLNKQWEAIAVVICFTSLLMGLGF